MEGVANDSPQTTELKIRSSAAAVKCHDTAMTKMCLKGYVAARNRSSRLANLAALPSSRRALQFAHPPAEKA